MGTLPSEMQDFQALRQKCLEDDDAWEAAKDHARARRDDGKAFPNTADIKRALNEHGYSGRATSTGSSAKSKSGTIFNGWKF